MRSYEIVYCFVDEKGRIERFEDGMEKIYVKKIEAYNGGQAIDKFKEEEKFIESPEILSVREEQRCL